MRIHTGQRIAAHLKADNQHQQQNLAVEAWLPQIAPHPAVDAEVHKRRKRPDLFLFDKAPIKTGYKGNGKVEGQAQVLMVQHGGNGKQSASAKRGERAHEDAQQNRRFKGNIGGVEIRNGRAHPDPERKRDADEGQQSQRFAGIAVFRKEQALKGAGASQRAGYCRSYAQLDQQSNEYQLLLDHPLTLPLLHLSGHNFIITV